MNDDYESRPAEPRHPHRRSTDGTLNSLAESSILKVLQYAITVIAVPLVTWAVNNVADRLGQMEKALNRYETTAATSLVELQSLKDVTNQHSATLRLLSDKVIGLEYEMRALQRIQGK